MAELVQRPPSWIDHAPIRVQESVLVDAPPSAVWAVVADHERWPEWFATLSRVEVTRGATGIGGGRRVRVGPAVVEEEFTAWDEPGDETPGHFAFTVVRAPGPLLRAMAESVVVEPLDGGARSRVTYRQGLEARRWFGPALRAAWSIAARGLREALPALKARAEAS